MAEIILNTCLSMFAGLMIMHHWLAADIVKGKVYVRGRLFKCEEIGK